MALSEASKKGELDKINNSLGFLSTEIGKTITELNYMLTEISGWVSYDDCPSNEFKPITSEDKKVYMDVSGAKCDQVKFQQKINYLKSCITEAERLRNNIPIKESFSQEELSEFRKNVNKAKQRKQSKSELNVSSFSNDKEPSFIKTESGLIVPSKKVVRNSDKIQIKGVTYAPDYKIIEGVPKSQVKDRQLTPNWKLSEFDDRPPYNMRVPEEYVKYTTILANGLDQMASKLGVKKLNISSAYRNYRHQVACHSTTMRSLHRFGAAADVLHHGKPEAYWNAAGQTGFTSIIIYPGNSFIHVDIRAQCDALHATGTVSTHFYNRNGGHGSSLGMQSGWKDGVSANGTTFPVAGNDGGDNQDTPGVLSFSGGVPTGDGYVNGLNLKNLYETDNYYGWGSKQEINIEVSDEEPIAKIKTNTSMGVSALANKLSMSTSALRSLNPNLENSNTVSSGTTIYVPTTTSVETMKYLNDANAATLIQENAIGAMASNYSESIGSAFYSSASTQDSSAAEIVKKAFQEELNMGATKTVDTVLSKAVSASAIEKLKASTNVEDINIMAYSSTINGASVHRMPKLPKSLTTVSTNNEYYHSQKDLLRIIGVTGPNAYIEAQIILINSGKARIIKTVINPVSYSETYSTSVNLHQTTGGWFMSRHGENPVSLNINGYLLDTPYSAEKHSLIEEWKTYLTDQVDSKGNYYNKTTTEIQLEGIRYKGVINSISFGKDANRPSLSTFQMNFTCLTYKITRPIVNTLNRLKSKATTGSSSATLGSNIGKTLSK